MASSSLSGAGVVISAGKMAKTVTVRMVKRQWHRHLRKNYYTPFKFLVHDPNNSLVEGDVIKCEPERYSKSVKYVVSRILAPFGRPVEERPRILTPEERASLSESKFRAKNERRAARGIRGAIRILDSKGWALSDAADAIARTSGAETGRDGLIMEHGRTVLPDGTHKYGGRGEGGINKESLGNKRKATSLQDRAVEHEAETERVQSMLPEDLARQKLQQ